MLVEGLIELLEIGQNFLKFNIFAGHFSTSQNLPKNVDDRTKEYALKIYDTLGIEF